MSASLSFAKIPAHWSEETHFIDKNRIFIRLYRKNLNTPQTGRWLFIVHGHGEQSDRYEHFPFYLQSSLDAVALIDLPGHGNSKGTRGHIQNFDQYSQTVIDGFQFCQNYLKISEAHWLGHSLGGLITLRTLLKKQNLNLTSSTVSAPLLGLSLPVPKLKKFFGVLIEPLLGRLLLKGEVDENSLSQDKSVTDYYTKNPLNHPYVTPRFFVTMSRELELMKTPASEFAYPLLMILPLDDSIVSWKSAWKFFERLKMKNGLKKELQTFPNLRHEAFNELEKERVFLAFENWILKNSKK